MSHLFFFFVDEHSHAHEHEHTAVHSEKGKEAANTAVESEHDHEHSMIDDHSLIGITLVSGFIFMLLVDQIGGGGHHIHSSTGKSAVEPQKSSLVFEAILSFLVIPKYLLPKQ